MKSRKEAAPPAKGMIPFRSAQNKRNLAIYNRWRLGKETYEEIGADYGLTRQRIHTIICAVEAKLYK